MGISDDLILDAPGVLPRTERFCLSIGGICCGVMGHDIHFLEMLRSRYHMFESTGPAAYEILVRLVSTEEFAQENMRQPAYAPVTRVNSGDNYIIKRVDNPFVAVVNTSSRKVLVKMLDSQYCFDSFLRMLFTLILTGERGLLLHASAVSDNGRGSVFFGPPGHNGGDTSHPAPGRTVLTDELVLVRPHNGGYRVYGTPFWGEFTPGRNNARAELCGLYALRRDRENGLLPMGKAQAVTELCQCVLFFNDDSDLLSQIRHICCGLVDSVPVYELHFRPDASFWQVASEHG